MAWTGNKALCLVVVKGNDTIRVHIVSLWASFWLLSCLVCPRDFIHAKMKVELEHKGGACAVAEPQQEENIVFPGCHIQVTVERLE